MLGIRKSTPLILLLCPINKSANKAQVDILQSLLFASFKRFMKRNIQKDSSGTSSIMQKKSLFSLFKTAGIDKQNKSLNYLRRHLMPPLCIGQCPKVSDVCQAPVKCQLRPDPKMLCILEVVVLTQFSGIQERCNGHKVPTVGNDTPLQFDASVST